MMCWHCKTLKETMFSTFSINRYLNLSVVSGTGPVFRVLKQRMMVELFSPMTSLLIPALRL